MSFQLVETNGNKKIVYNSIVVEPKKLNIFGSELALKIAKELAINPGCAMDLARKLNEHEQKIYYHLRRLEDVGVIKQIRTEKRYAMTAKIYSLASPVIAAKLHEDSYELKDNTFPVIDRNIEKFLHPFVENGKLNAKIIIGDSYSHGKYDAASTEGPYIFDFAVFLGHVLQTPEFPHYKLDTEVDESDLDDNLILFGNAKTNAVIDMVNSKLPIYFNVEKGCSIVSKISKKTYEDARTGMILKTVNPLNTKKSILIIGGVRTRGTQSAIIAFTRHFDDIFMKSNRNGDITCIVEGFDKDSDKIIDSVRFLEK
jgi:DNA-binding transcriptional ArsR family regulator